MSYDVNTIHELISAFGGPTVLGESLGLSPSAVCNWALRGYISPSWHLRLLVELKRRGLSANPDLFEATPEEFEVLFPGCSAYEATAA